MVNATICVSFDCDSAISLVVRDSWGYLQCNWQTQSSWILCSLPGMHQSFCFFSVITPALNKGHPVVPVVEDGAMIQSRYDICNSFVNSFDILDGGAIFI